MQGNSSSRKFLIGRLNNFKMLIESYARKSSKAPSIEQATSFLLCVIGSTAILIVLPTRRLALATACKGIFKDRSVRVVLY